VLFFGDLNYRQTFVEIPLTEIPDRSFFLRISTTEGGQLKKVLVWTNFNFFGAKNSASSVVRRAVFVR
jgi:hypothetical protein